MNGGNGYNIHDTTHQTRHNETKHLRKSFKFQILNGVMEINESFFKIENLRRWLYDKSLQEQDVALSENLFVAIIVVVLSIINNKQSQL